MSLKSKRFGFLYYFLDLQGFFMLSFLIVVHIASKQVFFDALKKEQAPVFFFARQIGSSDLNLLFISCSQTRTNALLDYLYCIDQQQ